MMPSSAKLAAFFSATLSAVSGVAADFATAFDVDALGGGDGEREADSEPESDSADDIFSAKGRSM